MNKGIDRSITHLFPPFADILEDIIMQVIHETEGKHGVKDWLMNEGYRSYARQVKLYREGRQDPGKIVTHTLHSNHLLGIAADLVPVSEAGIIMWDAHPDIWNQYGHVIRCFPGMQWGGDFPKIHPGSTFIDLPHCEASLELRKQWGTKPEEYLRSIGLH